MDKIALARSNIRENENDERASERGKKLINYNVDETSAKLFEIRKHWLLTTLLLSQYMCLYSNVSSTDAVNPKNS